MDLKLNQNLTPNYWVWQKLEDAVDILDNERNPINSSEREQRIAGKNINSLFPYYGATGQVGWIDGFLFDDERVLLGEDGAPFLEANKEKAYLVKGKCWVNNHAHVIKAKAGISLNKYVLHYLNFFDYHGFVTGTTRYKLTQAQMRSIPIPLAPLPEQQRVVAKIEELFTQLDAAETALKRARANLKRYRQSVLQAAVTGELTRDWRKAHQGEIEPASELLKQIQTERRSKWEADQRAKGKDPKTLKYEEPLSPIIENLLEIPNEWLWVTMPQIGELNRGKSKHRPRNAEFLYGGSYPFIQTGDVRFSQGAIKEYHQTYSESGLQQSKLWPAGTLCITIAANIAETGILEFEACFPDSIVGFLPTPKLCETKFIEYFIRTGKEALERFAPATAQKNINLEILSKLAIPYPSMIEQKEIIAAIDEIFSIVDQNEKQVKTSLERISRLRQSILQCAFSGQLVPQESNL